MQERKGRGEASKGIIKIKHGPGMTIITQARTTIRRYPKTQTHKNGGMNQDRMENNNRTYVTIMLLQPGCFYYLYWGGGYIGGKMGN